ncbi:MAG: bifunctional NUDIX hydrolase/histidine phosphatase family protein [Chloroflexota bacterium]
MSSNPIRAAGGVLWRQAAGTNGDNEVEVAIIHRPRYDDWSMPKGKLNPGEIELEGAVREIAEETGYRVTVGPPLGIVEYEKLGRPKVVRYWAMRAEGGMFVPSREVDELRWLHVDDAFALLTQPRDVDLLKRFARKPAATKAVLIVRHGSAGYRSDWKGDDDDRPLDEVGEEQAEAMVWLLCRFDVREVISAPPLRCTSTIAPLAVAVGLAVREEPLIGEHDYYGHERKTLDFIRNAGTAGTGTVLCSQGGVIPDILHRLAAADGYPLPDPIVAKKGSIWSLTFAEDKLFAAEYYPPLTQG